MVMKKILVPTDFSNAATWALEVAAKIALKAQVEIVLLHVIEQPTSESFNASGEIDASSHWVDKLFTLKMIERGKALLDAAARPWEEQGLPVRREIRIGNPFHGMQTIIADHQVDLIVMGTSDHSKMEEWLIGSNTEKVVRYANCPVLTIHHRMSDEGIKNMVYATSLSETEHDFAVVVKRAQELLGGVVHVVRINTPMNFRPDTEIKIAMENFVRRAHLQNYTLNIFNDFSEEEGILHFASSVQADLIAMATHGRTGFAHVLAGSIAEDVVNHSMRPVLTFVVR
jgi:nucleotide-binding universal stress UspA family protein